MRSDHDAIKGTVVFNLTVMCTLFDKAFNAVICRFVHAVILLIQ